MLAELAIGTLVGLAAWRAAQPGPGVMTPKMRKIYQHALTKTDPPLTPEALLELADVFDANALTAYSEVIRKRAKMRAQSPQIKAAHRAAYRKAMGSTDPLSIRVLANAFEGQGKTALASSLRNAADLLDSVVQQKVAGPPPSTAAAIAVAAQVLAGVPAGAGPNTAAAVGSPSAVAPEGATSSGIPDGMPSSMDDGMGSIPSTMHGEPAFGGPSNQTQIPAPTAADIAAHAAELGVSVEDYMTFQNNDNTAAAHGSPQH